jgi:hypothetical protein
MPYFIALGIFYLLFNMSILHYFGRTACIICSKTHRHLMSFGTGVIIAYIITTLIPKIHGELGFYGFLGGFVLFFLMEAFVYKKVPRHELGYRLQLLHEVILFSAHFLGGAIFLALAKISLSSSFLFFLMFLFVTMSEDFSLHFLHGKEKTLPQLIVSISFLLGIVASYLTKSDLIVLETSKGILGGTLLFVVTNEAMRKQKERHIVYFLLGILSLVGFNLVVD